MKQVVQWKRRYAGRKQFIDVYFQRDGKTMMKLTFERFDHVETTRSWWESGATLGEMAQYMRENRIT